MEEELQELLQQCTLQVATDYLFIKERAHPQDMLYDLAQELLKNHEQLLRILQP